MKRVKPVGSAAVIVRVYPEERNSLRFNAGARHEHVGHIRQTRLGVRLRKGDKPSRYFVRRDYRGKDTAPRQVLRGDLAMIRALIGCIKRRRKFRSRATR